MKIKADNYSILKYRKYENSDTKNVQLMLYIYIYNFP